MIGEIHFILKSRSITLFFLTFANGAKIALCFYILKHFYILFETIILWVGDGGTNLCYIVECYYGYYISRIVNV
jgi:hypothetical protein